jgi:hypothetical protein
MRSVQASQGLITSRTCSYKEVSMIFNNYKEERKEEGEGKSEFFLIRRCLVQPVVVPHDDVEVHFQQLLLG